MRCTIYFDGACEPVNPGGLGTYGFVIYGENGKRVARGYGVACSGSSCTNNVAEYTALREALKRALELGCSQVVVKGDSQLVVKQIRGEWGVNSSRLLALRDEVEELLGKFDSWEIQWVPREENREADGLSQIAYELHAAEYGYGKGDQTQELLSQLKRSAEAEGLTLDEAASVLTALLRRYKISDLRALVEGD
ncbi:ribonuclease HI [Thermoproteus tenax]|uniref:Ribonuclease HI n=1 Tax=Thermoproteus tenax (strain ATCC 35583 / DSM 2078 / JCM 9277 / NBRC 100435 / Kra 1) TaxID=768679 RepID=G4RNN0_THETK|nr:ribonuclease HI [Thermoproteus tenax]CCC81174.1 ribonuclease HI [Thermoproteus tenax Kra 1]